MENKKHIKSFNEASENLNISDVSKTERTLPFAFVKWYSGMKTEQIENAYKRYLNEVKR